MRKLCLATSLALAMTEMASAENTAAFGEAVPVINAVQQADLAKVEAEIQSGATLTAPDALGRTALHYAAALGHVDIVARLIEAEVDPDLRDGEGITPLMRAAQNGHLATVMVLLSSGADPDLQDEAARTAASLGADFPEIVAALQNSAQ